MGSPVTMTLNTAEFRQAILGVHRDTGRLVEFIVAEQMALWSKDLLSKTIPTGVFGNAVGSDRQIGENAVQNDLEKIFEPIRDPSVLTKWAESDDTGTVLYRKSKSGKLMKIDKDLLRGTLEGWHRQHRRKNTGRTWMPKVSGDVAWGGRFPVPAAALATYAKSVKQHVGKTKSAWIPAVKYFCARTNGVVRPATRGQEFAFRHASFGSSYGSGSQTSDKRRLYSRGVAGNSVRWIRDDGLMAATRATRLADLNGPYYRLRLQRIMNKYSARSR